jgi:hypothetical protein
LLHHTSASETSLSLFCCAAAGPATAYTARILAWFRGSFRKVTEFIQGSDTSWLHTRLNKDNRAEPMSFRFLGHAGGTRKGMPLVNTTSAAAARGTLKAEGPHEAATFFFSPSGRVPLANKVTPQRYMGCLTEGGFKTGW